METPLQPDKRAEKIRELRSKLDSLNRAPLRTPPAAPVEDPLKRDLRKSLRVKRRVVEMPAPGSPEVAAVPTGLPESIVYHRDIPAATRHAHTAAAPASIAVLEQLVEGTVRHSDEWGRAFVITTPVRSLPEAPDVDRLFSACISCAGTPLIERLKRQYDAPAFSSGDFIFVDIETTGLRSSPLFLIGVMVWEKEGLVVRQYFARTYAEEAAVIDFFAKECSSRTVIVTFNGKTFDYPYIRNRAAATGVRLASTLPHFDLLHECRRIWKSSLPDCKLQTLERYVCNRLRYGDIPGALIPQAYHDFVRTQNAWQMVDVLKHNMLDLVTLGELMGRWPERVKTEGTRV